MTRKLLLLFTLGGLLSFDGAVAGQTGAVEELLALCKTVTCRQPGTIRLKLKGGKPFEVSTKLPSPFVGGSVVSVLAGETVLIEGTLKEGRVVDLVAVRKLVHPERTITLKLVQMPDSPDGVDMMLTVTNPFAGVLKYKLAMMSPTEEGRPYTSVCPVPPGRVSYEHWPFPLFQVFASDFRQVDPSSAEAGRCE